MSGGVPAGWVLVPVEPTEAMLDASWKQTGESEEMRARTHAHYRRHYAAMLAATPIPPSRDADVERVEMLARIIDPEAFDPAVEADADYPAARKRLADKRDAATTKARAALQALGERG